MKLLFVVLLSGFILSACSTTGETSKIVKVTFKCSDEKLYKVSIYQDKNQAELLDLALPGGKNITLINVVAASGVRYVGATYEWWGKGNDAIFSNAGEPPLSCALVETKE